MKIKELGRIAISSLTIFIVLVAIVVLFNKMPATITGYAVSNVFFTTVDETSTVGVVAREASIDEDDFKVESAIIMPSGEFTKDDYTVTLPYLKMESTGMPAPPPPPGTPPDGSSSERREYETVMGDVCEGSWQCSGYGKCQPNNLQYRVCVVVNCEHTDEIFISPKPSEVKSCEYEAPEEPEEEEPEEEPQPIIENLQFSVKPKTEKKYKPGDGIILHTYIKNPSDNNLENLEIEYNIDEGTRRTVFVEYEGIFNVNAKSEFKKDIQHSLTGYENQKYKIHATLYSDGEELAESYYDLDLT